MDTIILAGGYAKRMVPTTNEVPKQLLPVAGRPMLSYIIDSLERLYLERDGTCYISVNQKYAVDFRNFIDDKKPSFPIELAVESSTSESDKLGSMGALNEIKKSRTGDALVIGGDNLFSLDIVDFVDFYDRNNERSLVALFDIKDRKLSRLYGVAELEQDSNKVVGFEEKPERPKSTLVSTALYLFKEEDFRKIPRYFREMKTKDTLGSYLRWLVEKDNLGMNGFVFEGYWFDIGMHKSFEEANKILRKRILETKEE